MVNGECLEGRAGLLAKIFNNSSHLLARFLHPGCIHEGRVPVPGLGKRSRSVPVAVIHEDALLFTLSKASLAVSHYLNFDSSGGRLGKANPA